MDDSIHALHYLSLIVHPPFLATDELTLASSVFPLQIIGQRLDAPRAIPPDKRPAVPAR